MLGDAFEVRKAASSVEIAGERPVPRRPHAGPSSGRSPANPTLLGASLTSKPSPSIQNPDFEVDIAKIRALGLCSGQRKRGGIQVGLRFPAIPLLLRASLRSQNITKHSDL